MQLKFMQPIPDADIELFNKAVRIITHSSLVGTEKKNQRFPFEVDTIIVINTGIKTLVKDEAATFFEIHYKNHRLIFVLGAIFGGMLQDRKKKKLNDNR